MNDSLDSLVKNLVDKDFKHLSREFSGKRLELVKEKGVYPYEYMNSFKKFDECELPNKDALFSSLKGKGINNKDYLRAIKVWNIFDIKIWVNIMIYNLKLIFCCYAMCLKSLLMFV